MALLAQATCADIVCGCRIKCAQKLAASFAKEPKNVISRTILSGILLLSGAAMVACTAPAETPAEGDTLAETATDALSQIPATGLSKDQVKAKVRSLTSEDAAQNDVSRLGATRTRLNPVIADLARLYKAQPVTAELENGLAGTWKQLWTDDFRAPPPGAPKADAASIFQVVTGTYVYNFSNQIIPTPPGAPKVVVGAFLRAEESVSAGSSVLDIVFTRLGILPTALPAPALIAQLAKDIESGAVGAGGPPGAGGPRGAGGPPGAGAMPGARGPIGVKGKLRNLYLDGDLRVVIGGTADQSFNKFYILERVKP